MSLIQPFESVNDPRLADELPNLLIGGRGSPALPPGVWSITLDALGEVMEPTWEGTSAGVDPWLAIRSRRLLAMLPLRFRRVLPMVEFADDSDAGTTEESAKASPPPRMLPDPSSSADVSVATVGGGG